MIDAVADDSDPGARTAATISAYLAAIAAKPDEWQQNYDEAGERTSALAHQLLELDGQIEALTARRMDVSKAFHRAVAEDEAFIRELGLDPVEVKRAIDVEVGRERQEQLDALLANPPDDTQPGG